MRWGRLGFLVIGTLLLGSIAAADSNSLYGIHWWGYSPGQAIDDGPARLLDAPEFGGWSTETILTHSSSWWRADYFRPLYQDLYTNKNISLITRIDYNWGETVPAPTNPDHAAWPASVAAEVNTLAPYAHIWQLGNEPNLLLEGNNWPEKKIQPQGYAQIYRAVRQAIHDHAGPSPAGPHRVLIAAPSPGGPIPNVRWMESNQWLGGVIDHIPAAEIDGFAIHAYGGTIHDFMSSIQSVIALIDSKGLQDKPIYLTEWNRHTPPENPAMEGITAEFLRQAFEAVHEWNQGYLNHNIICMTWFIYDANQQAGGGWNGYAIEYWRDHGLYPQGDPKNLYTAFEQVVDRRYPAGHEGIRLVKADFSAEKVRGGSPLTVQFADESLGEVTAYHWDFGDGQTSALAEPSHTFMDVGSYTITLTATGASGDDTLVKEDYVEVIPQPGDLDGDGDVDQADFGKFQRCITGPYTAQIDPFCKWARLDDDLDVDNEDVMLFLKCYSGPGIPARGNCLDQ